MPYFRQFEAQATRSKKHAADGTVFIERATYGVFRKISNERMVHLSRQHPKISQRADSSFSQRLHELLRQLSIPVAPGPAADAYTLQFSGEPNVYVMSAASGTVLFAAREAGVLPLAPPSAMLSRLLALNHQPAGDIDAAVSLDARSGTVVVSSRYRLTAIDAALFNIILDAIRRKTTAVQDILSGAAMSTTHRPAHRSWRG